MMTLSKRLAVSTPLRGHKPLVSRLFLAASIWRERRALESLDAHLLSDIGKTAAQAKGESDRPVWDAPSRWMD